MLLRAIEFVALVACAAAAEATRSGDFGLRDASVLPALVTGTLAFYVTFGYLLVAGVVFFAAWRRARARPVALPWINALPLAVWGAAMTVFAYGLHPPRTLVLGFLGAIAVNFLAGHLLGSRSGPRAGGPERR